MKRFSIMLIFPLLLFGITNGGNATIINGNFETGILSPFREAGYNRGPVMILFQPSGNRVSFTKTGPVSPPDYSTGIFSDIFTATGEEA